MASSTRMTRWWLSGAPIPVKAARGSRLPAGGWLSFRTGHYEVTQEAAERFGFSSAAVAILRDAAQDPDFYEWNNPAAHAQTPDEAGYLAPGGPRDEAIEDAQRAFVEWVGDKAGRLARLAAGKPREALFYLGYLLHGAEDLAPHAGRTNAEHAHNDPNPDEDSAAVDLARAYAFQTLRAARELLGPEAFDRLRRWDGGGRLAKREKEALLGHGWDLSAAALVAYERSAKTWDDRVGRPVRWPRERVFGQMLERITGLREGAGEAPGRRRRRGAAGEDAVALVRAPRLAFEVLNPAPAPVQKADWTVLVYMAGDDANANGIEYAVRQDLLELKRAGSSARVNLVAQTDEVRDRYSYRYRLRRGTTLQSDRLAVFRGDLNTGRIQTLIDFVRWAHATCPADRYALILWGHGTGHDDHDVYRLARGRVSPRLAVELARRRLGFFGNTRRALLERTGPARGYGYDDTSGDFLDDVELQSALRRIHEVLGRPLDLLGFDACLMSMVEVAYQVRDHARVIVASQLTEPGDGWSYSSALAGLLEDPSVSAEQLGSSLVADFQRVYGDAQTLAAVRLDRIAALADELEALAGELAAATFDRARPRAIDCSPQRGLGYRDLGSFLQAIGAPARAAQRALKATVLKACGRKSGLCVYLPSDYAPDEVGGTDALYERLDFPARKGWARLLRRVYVDRGVLEPPARATKPEPRHGSLYALDRHNAGEVLRGLFDRRPTTWAERLRAEVLRPLANLAEAVVEKLDGGDGGDEQIQIFVLPGIMASQLSDRRGHHGLCWVDPIGLAIGSDFQALALEREGTTDLDPAVQIEPSGLVPVVYDRLALALLAAFGPVVEQVPFDWRRPIAWNGQLVAARIRRYLEGGARRRVAIVAHSMGGLVGAHALRGLGALANRVVGMVAMATPWLGSMEAALNLRGEGDNIRQFDRLTRMGRDDLLRVAHTFWGLTDLLPARADLLQPRLYTAGPLGREPAGTPQLASPAAMDRRPFARTFAVVSDRQATVVNLTTGPDATVVREIGPGDGTVPLWSSTHQGALPYAAVDEPHSTVPLDGVAIDHTLARLEAWLGGARGTRGPRAAGRGATNGRAPVRVGPLKAPDASRGGDRTSLLERLDSLEDTTLPLGTLLTLMPFA